MKQHQCNDCGKYAKYEDLDSYTPFGCSDPSNPSPFDPTNICPECQERLFDYFLGCFKNGNYKVGHWQKSKAERKAAKECNLIWIGNNSDYQIDGRRAFNEYVPEYGYREWERCRESLLRLQKFAEEKRNYHLGIKQANAGQNTAIERVEYGDHKAAETAYDIILGQIKEEIQSNFKNMIKESKS